MHLVFLQKLGLNIDQVLERIITDFKPPIGEIEKPLKCLVFDSFYDNYKGAVSYVKVVEGSLKVGEEILFMATNKKFVVTELGYLEPGSYVSINELKAGDVGYVSASIKTVSDLHVGDTITKTSNQAKEALPGYKKVKPMVFCGLYPLDGGEYENLKLALEKLKLNDSSLQYEQENSVALGFGFRCGFLGLLHLEIIGERLEREFDLNLITTAPSVIYKVHKRTGEIIDLYNPIELPQNQEISYIEEPIVKTEIMTPKEYVR